MCVSLKISTQTLLLLIVVHCIKLFVATWNLHPDTSFVYNDRSAVGVYNDTIFIIGGVYDEDQLTEYQWTTSSYKIKQAPTSNLDVWGAAQFWTQQQHLIYYIQHLTNKIASFNMKNKQFINDVFSFPFAALYSYAVCLTATDESMYVIGAKDNGLKLVQILTLSTSKWTIITNMLQSHSAAACIAENNYLWTFSGSGTKTNERILTKNITQNEWQFVDSFTTYMYGIRCVSWKESIYIIGGFAYPDSQNIYYKTVHVVDSETGSITELSDLTPIASAYTAPIIVDGVLYVFGGIQDNGYHSMYNLMYYSLPSYDPTNYPSNDPSVDPTEATYDPTEATTTANPTFYPSVQPTAAPIETLSNDPTQAMSVNPTKEPNKTSIDTTSDPHVVTPSDDPLISYKTTPNPAKTPYEQTLMIINPEILETTHDASNDRIETNSNTFTAGVDASSGTNNNNLMVLLYCVAIGLSLCICGVVIFIFFIGCKMRKKHKKQAVVEDNILEDDALEVRNDLDNDQDILEMNAITEEGPTNAIQAICGVSDDDDDILDVVNVDNEGIKDIEVIEEDGGRVLMITDYKQNAKDSMVRSQAANVVQIFENDDVDDDDDLLEEVNKTIMDRSQAANVVQMNNTVINVNGDNPAVINEANEEIITEGANTMNTVINTKLIFSGSAAITKGE